MNTAEIRNLIHEAKQRLDLVQELLNVRNDFDRIEAEVLGNTGLLSHITKQVIDLVVEEFGTSRRAILGRMRTEEVALARQIVMALVTERSKASLGAVARQFKRDHATVIHAIKAVNNRCDVDPEFRQRVERLRERVKGL